MLTITIPIVPTLWALGLVALAVYLGLATGMLRAGREYLRTQFAFWQMQERGRPPFARHMRNFNVWGWTLFFPVAVASYWLAYFDLRRRNERDASEEREGE